MSVDSHLADLPVEALRDVEFEVDAKDDLDNQHEHEPICEGGVDVVREGSAFVQVSEEVGGDCDEGSEDLKRDVPAVADYPKDHSCREDDAERQHHQEDMYP